jgi:cell division transport system permease protein
LDFIRRGMVLATLLLGAGVIAIVGNTIRLDIQNRREEIEVTKLVGGSNAFVRRPFLYTGIWYGLGGGLIAWLTTVLVTAALGGSVQRLAGLYGSSFRLSGLELRWSLLLIVLAVLLGWLGSWVATTMHLHRIEPK